MYKSNYKSWIINALVAATYIVLTIVANSFGLAVGVIQLRLSEGLNHLVIFNKKYFWGVASGVFLFNLLGPTSLNNLLDVIFGTSQTVISLLLTICVVPKIKTTYLKFILNSLFFAVSMILITIELHMTVHLPFWQTYFSTFTSEFLVMMFTAPVMIYADKIFRFKDRII